MVKMSKICTIHLVTVHKIPVTGGRVISSLLLYSYTRERRYNCTSNLMSCLWCEKRSSLSGEKLVLTFLPSLSSHTTAAVPVAVCA